MKIIASVIVFACFLLSGCWREDLGGFKFQESWTTDLDLVYSSPSSSNARLTNYFDMLTTASGESFVLLKGMKDDSFQYIISKISKEGKVVKEFTRLLPDEFSYAYMRGFLSEGKLIVFLTPAPGYQFLILELDMELNMLKEIPFTPHPDYYHSNYLPLGEYIYGVRFGSSDNMYVLDKMDFVGNTIWSWPIESKQFPIINILDRTIRVTNANLDSTGMVTTISITGLSADGKVLGQHTVSHLHGLQGQGCGSGAIEKTLMGSGGSSYFIGYNYPLGLSYFAVSPAGELIYAKTSATYSTLVAEMTTGDLLYLSLPNGSSQSNLQLVQLNRIGNPVWMSSFENLAFNRGLTLSTDGAGNAYLLTNGQIRQLKR